MWVDHGKAIQLRRTQTRSRAIRERFRHRADMCARYRIGVAEYERRFEAWKELRALHRSIVKSEQQREARRELSDRIMMKRQGYLSRKAAADAKKVIDRPMTHFSNRLRPVD